jgi:cytoskeleton protein RodZ
MNASSGSVPGAVPGERLRAERERRGLSTQKVAEDLHVDVWVVEALEQGRHATLGAPVYVKGHLRKYALLLGLDAEALVGALSEQDPPLVLLKPQTRRRRSLRFPVRRIVIGILVVVILAGAFWAYRTWRERSENAIPAAQPAPSIAPAGEMPAVAAQSESAPPAATPGQASAEAPERGRATSNASTADTAALPTVRVRLSFSADSWVELYDANERRVFFELGVANTARSFTVATPARIFLGYADAVQVEVDGRPVTLVDSVRRGNVAHFSIDARGRVKPAGSLSR